MIASEIVTMVEIEDESVIGNRVDDSSKRTQSGFESKVEDPYDPNSTYYLTPSETLTSGACKFLLKGANYLIWKREILRSLSVKIGFVAPAFCKKPRGKK